MKKTRSKGCLLRLGGWSGIWEFSVLFGDQVMTFSDTSCVES